MSSDSNTLPISVKNGQAYTKHVQKLLRILENLQDGNYVIRIESNDIVGEPRKRYFAILQEISRVTGDEVKDLHELCKMQFNLNGSTSDFKSNREWNDYINDVVSYFRTTRGLELPDPRDITLENLLHLKDNYYLSRRGI